jgi:hypothetical protein
MIAIGLALAGCGPIGWTRVTVNRPLSAREVSFIVPGATKWSEVMSRLGAPDELIDTCNGIVADYFYSDSKSFDINFGWPLTFIPAASHAPHSFALGGRGIGTNSFQVTFDARGVVQYAAFSRGQAAAPYRLWPFESTTP